MLILLGFLAVKAKPKFCIEIEIKIGLISLVRVDFVS
jgi:hypothetical protein